MKEKEKMIMDSAMKLIAAKGFDATSIQEIANHAGISKGAFYLHFKSKEALLLDIFKYNYEMIKARIEHLKSLNLPPKDLFIEHIVCQYEAILNQKEFIIMQTREQAVPFNESIGEFIKNMRIEAAENTRFTICSLYGEKAASFQWDLTILVQGMFSAYLELLIFQSAKLDLYELAAYILKRTDDLVEGLLKSGDPPMLSTKEVEDLIAFPLAPDKLDKMDLTIAIGSAKEDFKDSEEHLVSLEVIENELSSEAPRAPVIKGMLHNLRKEKELDSLVRKIAAFFDIQED
ncbi:TetR/AcrR family transcriptional regulator [Peribacillus deserti]|uniref:TetR family transcriptional regulator n=1 Tax=Peribacillus deserti TaxID=673318 RepID=A0A2N5M8K2_9BACI|nr:TetR/AcrR family transcriptional regulator [Peribacillus deserti]PLT30694.1 TetR family transcriptional regulator [Peribacillus deserti]